MANPRIPYRLSGNRPRLPPLDGRGILAHLVVNVEHWVFDEPMPRTILTPPHGRATSPDVPNFSWVDYGMRAGLSRILSLLRSRGIPASTSFNAGVIDAYPEAAAAMRDAGWEFIGHGVRQRTLNESTLNESRGEAGVIAETIRRITDFTGTRPRGWLSPGLRETAETPDILKEQGIDYVFDWMVDDLPSWMTTRHGPLIAMPYNLELNDSVIYAVEKQATGAFAARLEHTLRLFEAECAENVRVLALGLHPHLIGVPHRFHELVRMLDLLQASPQVTFVTGAAIADWFVRHEAPAA